MQVDLKTVPYYILTCAGRAQHVKDTFHALHHTIVAGTTPTDETVPRDYLKTKLICGALGSAKTMLMAISAQPFVPFVFCEDDVSFTSWHPTCKITVPTNADGVMLGISKAGLQPNTMLDGEPLYGYDIPHTDTNRVYNMLSTHAILFLTAAYATAHYGALMEAVTHGVCGRERGWDTCTARLQLTYNVYALRAPVLYQNARVGGMEAETLLRDLVLTDLSPRVKREYVKFQGVAGLYPGAVNVFVPHKMQVRVQQGPGYLGADWKFVADKSQALVFDITTSTEGGPYVVQGQMTLMHDNGYLTLLREHLPVWGEVPYRLSIMDPLDIVPLVVMERVPYNFVRTPFMLLGVRTDNGDRYLKCEDGQLIMTGIPVGGDVEAYKFRMEPVYDP